jgi:hypothetical protein
VEPGAKSLDVLKLFSTLIVMTGNALQVSNLDVQLEFEAISLQIPGCFHPACALMENGLNS